MAHDDGEGTKAPPTKKRFSILNPTNSHNADSRLDMRDDYQPE
jgi:hypothetical protein